MAFTATPYSYGIRNLYRPTNLITNAYGWSTHPHYSRADVPTGLMNKPGAMTDAEFLQNFAYEWFESEQLGGDHNLSNPPFTTGAAGRLHPSLRDSETGKPARILRGYIRRAQSEAGDNRSKSRLYFMYNPEVITRDYVSYLNQAALDPFNSVYQSGNLVAPPSFMDFSFSLFFDRQEEARRDDHPGVFVDYQFFDLVVRNVVPTDPNQTGNTLPDNGVMMVNPQDITVIFSPQLSVQGRPLNAQVQFEKFTHRMTPTRMTIQLQMRVIYMGPARDQVEYRAEELQAEAAIPWGKEPEALNQTFVSNEDATNAVVQDPAGTSDSDAAKALVLAAQGNTEIRSKALEWAELTVVQGGPNDANATKFVASTDASRHNFNPVPPNPMTCDDSGLITEAYRQVGAAVRMNWADWPGSGTIVQRISENTTTQQFMPLSSFDYTSQLVRGDILLRAGHMMWFVRYDGDAMIVFDANSATETPMVGHRSWAGPGNYEYWLIRPTPFGSTAAAADTPTNTGVNKGAYGALPPYGGSQDTLNISQTVLVSTGLATKDSPAQIRLAPAAVPSFNLWRQIWGGPIPCTSGWRDPSQQQKNYASNPKRFAPAANSYHCKGRAVDVDNIWLSALSAAQQSALRRAAAAAGWRQPRYKKGEAPCGSAPDGVKDNDEPWHFSWGGCG